VIAGANAVAESFFASLGLELVYQVRVRPHCDATFTTSITAPIASTVSDQRFGKRRPTT
jgi:hypothetical protein